MLSTTDTEAIFRSKPFEFDRPEHRSGHVGKKKEQLVIKVKKKFVPSEFVRSVGQDLICAFDFARMATTPGLVGDAMEKAVRDRLELILPRGIGVGSGCVIDTKGGTSRQMDIVLYEKEWCPVFCVNQNPATTYYPSDGVLAVGEIKSAIGKREFKDSFEKIASVKSLFRAFEKGDQNLYVGRKYGESGVGSAYGFHRDQTNLGDIFGFILAEKSTLPVTLSDPSKAHESKPKAVLLGHYRKKTLWLGTMTCCVLICWFY